MAEDFILSPSKPTDKPVPMDSGAPTIVRVLLTLTLPACFFLLTPQGPLGLLHDARASGSAGAWLRFVLWVVVASVALLTLVRLWRSGSWITGTKLVVRGWRTSSLDLAALSSIKVDRIRGRKGRLVPVLNVVTTTGRPRTVRLTVDHGRPLSPQQVHALVAAIAAGSRPGPHSEIVRKAIQDLTAVGRREGPFRWVIPY